MQQAVPVGRGAMAAVVQPALDLAALEAALAGGAVDLANINSPDQVVLSGPAEDVGAVRKTIREIPGFGRARAIPLKVSAPFHSRLMRPAEESFAPILEEAMSACRAEALETAVVASNLTGDRYPADAGEIARRLLGQISAPVRWLDDMRVVASQAGRVLEVGPGKPLRAFFAALGVDVEPVTTLDTARCLRA